MKSENLMHTNANFDPIVNHVINALEDVKAKDIVVLDVQVKTCLFSYIIIATGNSTRQVKAMGYHVEEQLKSSGNKIWGIEGIQNGEWVLVDAGEVIIHAMQPHIRQYYAIETLWGIEQSNPDELRVS